MNQTVVVYHANCADGHCAAWIAHQIYGDAADYVPAQYGDDPPDVRGRKVYILDFSFKRDILFKVVGDANGDLTILDHHKTAQAALAGFAEECQSNDIGNPTVVFDMGKSGGRLTWEHFYPDARSPWLVDYSEDRDLWLWKCDRSKEINAFLGSLPRTFEMWDALANQGKDSKTWDTWIDQGAAILRYQDQLVDAICATAREVKIGGYKVLAANTSVLFSDVAGKLAEGRPFGAAWFLRSDGKRQWSLRSRDNGIDVSEVSKKYGGGGHAHASGYEDRP